MQWTIMHCILVMYFTHIFWLQEVAQLGQGIIITFSPPYHYAT
jgi:hypothetical protein